MHSSVIVKNVSWPHFSWVTLYVYMFIYFIDVWLLSVSQFQQIKLN